MSLPLVSLSLLFSPKRLAASVWLPLFFPPLSSLRLRNVFSCLSLAFFRDANYVKYSHDTRMPLQDHGLTVVPVDDSLNYSQRLPPCLAASLPSLLHEMKKHTEESNNNIYGRWPIQEKPIHIWSLYFR